MNPNTLKKCKEITNKSIWINIYSDDPFNIKPFNDTSNNNVLKSIALYNYFFIWSKTLKKKLIKFSKMKKIIFLPFGYDEFLHKKKKSKKIIDFDISFVGTADEERNNLLQKLNKYKIIIAGDGWQKFSFNKNFKVINRSVNAKLNAKIIANSKICLNILRKQNDKSHNMKTFEICNMVVAYQKN